MILLTKLFTTFFQITQKSSNFAPKTTPITTIILYKFFIPHDTLPIENHHACLPSRYLQPLWVSGV